MPGILAVMARPNLSYLKNLLLFLLGLPLGVVTGLSGLAASAAAVPGLRALLGLLPARALATGLAVTFFAALACLLSFGQTGFLRGGLALLLLVGLSVGKLLGRRVPSSPSRRWLWGTLLALGGMGMTAQGLGLAGSPAGHGLRAAATSGLAFSVLALLTAVGVGAVSQVMGLGAELVVPAEIYLLGLTPHPAIGTALLVLALASLPGLWVLIRHRQVEPQSAVWLSAGGILGGLIGARAAVALPDTVLVTLYGLLLTALAVMHLWQRETPPAPDDL